MGKSQRTKGHKYEREIANRYKEAGFKESRRHLEYQDGEAKKHIDVHNVYPFAVQCKHWKNYPPVNKLCEVNAEDHEIPVIHLKGDRKKPIVALYEDDWMDLVETLKAEGIL